MALRVLQLVGSAVSDFLADLSRLYAGDCLAATADHARYDVHIAYVTPDRRWRFPAGLSPEAIDAAPAIPAAEAVAQIESLAPDVAVPQMFCLPGMTEYRALLDVLEIPYIGNRPDVMALAAHKARAKAVVGAAGVAVPRGELVRPGQTARLAPPVVVKPVDGDNSLGVSLVRDAAELPAAIDAAREHGSAALVESYVPLGREVRCGIVVVDGRPRCLPLEEYAVDAALKPIRGHDDKIRRGDDGTLALVAKEPSRAWIVDAGDPITAAVSEAALRCHAALGCRHYSLFDFRIDPSGRPWFLEAGLYCSFARQSVIAVMAAAAGIPVDGLFAVAIDGALRERQPHICEVSA